MQVLKEFISNIENYGNCEFFVRDYDFTNTVFKFVLSINDNRVIRLKKYWCVYSEEFLDKSNNDYINVLLKNQEYINDKFADNIAEIIIGATNEDAYCTHNLFLDNDNGKIMAEAIFPIFKYVLEDLDFFNYYFSSDIEKAYDYISYRIEKLFSNYEVLKNNNPLSLAEIIDIFENYIMLSQKDYKKISKAKTVDEYDSIIRKLK